MTKNEILNYLKELKPELFSHGIKSLGLFGSFAKEKSNENSDIDIVYETTDEFIQTYQGWIAFTYLNTNLRDKLINKFNVKVDMFDLNSDSIMKNKIKNEAIYV